MSRFAEMNEQEKAQYIEDLKTKFRRNLELIRQVIPNFQFDENTIDKYINEDRIKLHEQMADYSEKMNSVISQSEKSGVPSSYARIMYTIHDISGTSDAEKANEAITKKILAPDEESEKYRMQLYVDTVKGIKDLDPNGLDYNKPVEEIAGYYNQNIAMIERAWNFHEMDYHREDSLGFVLASDKEADIKKIEGKAQILGKRGKAFREWFSSEFALTLPLDELDDAQAESIIGSIPKFKDENGLSDVESNGMLDALLYKLSKAHEAAYEEPGDFEFGLEDLKDVKPGLEEAMSQLEGFQNQLLLYREQDGCELYGILEDTVANSINALSKIDRLTNKSYSSIRASFKELDEKAKYFKNYSAANASADVAESKNVNREKRVDVMNDIISLSKIVLGKGLAHDVFKEKTKKELAPVKIEEKEDSLEHIAEGDMSELQKQRSYQAKIKDKARAENIKKQAMTEHASIEGKKLADERKTAYNKDNMAMRGNDPLHKNQRRTSKDAKIRAQQIESDKFYAKERDKEKAQLVDEKNKKTAQKIKKGFEKFGELSAEDLKNLPTEKAKKYTNTKIEEKIALKGIAEEPELELEQEDEIIEEMVRDPKKELTYEDIVMNDELYGELEELGLDFDTIEESRMRLDLSLKEYVDKVIQMNREAQLEAERRYSKPAENPEPKALEEEPKKREFITLGDVERFLDDSKNPSPEELMDAFKACNKISEDNSLDLNRCYVAGELLTKVAAKLNKIEGNSEPILDKTDVSKARDTMERYFKAAEKMTVISPKEKEMSSREIDAVEKGGLVR